MEKSKSMDAGFPWKIQKQGNAKIKTPATALAGRALILESVNRRGS